MHLMGLLDCISQAIIPNRHYGYTKPPFTFILRSVTCWFKVSPFVTVFHVTVLNF
jgi:hypothetical protein